MQQWELMCKVHYADGRAPDKTEQSEERESAGRIMAKSLNGR